MPQTVGAMSWMNAKVEISVDAAFTTPTDLSGSTNTVTTGGGEIARATASTHGDKAPLVGYGSAAERTVEVGTLYTEVATEAFMLADQYYEDETPVYLRVTPDDTVAGQRRFKTSVGRILTPPQIVGEAGSAEFVQTTFTLTCATITWEDVP